jgi:hypothetical protein
LGRFVGLAAEERIAGEQALDGENQIARGLRFLNEAVSARFANVNRDSIRLVHRENQNAGSCAEPSDARGSFQTAHAMHREIQDDKVGLQSIGGLNGFLTTGCFAANLPVRTHGKEGPDSLPNNIVVIDD